MKGTQFAKWRHENDLTYSKLSEWQEIGNQLTLPCIPQFKQLIQSLPREPGGFYTVYDHYHAPHFSIIFVARGIEHSTELLSGPMYAPICLEPLLLEKLSLPSGILFSTPAKSVSFQKTRTHTRFQAKSTRLAANSSSLSHALRSGFQISAERSHCCVRFTT